jgi:hypothetical protein
MKQIYIVPAILCSLSGIACGRTIQSSPPIGIAVSGDSSISRAFKDKKSNVQIEGEGVVIRLLSDDLDGSRHQRFLLRLASGQTLLISHNIDIAPRVANLQKGDKVSFYGEYEWNGKGGVIHWTHRDPQGHHKDGWLKHDGRTYQ